MTEVCGYALIVAIKRYDKSQNLEERKVAYFDRQITKKAFTLLGFETTAVVETEEKPITTERFREELLESIKHVKTKGYRNFAVMISTHGEEGSEVDGNYEHMLCFYDEEMSTKEAIMDVLDKEIPKINKLVLVQACRSREDSKDGENEDKGVGIQLVDKIDDEYHDTKDPKPSPTQPPVPTTEGHCLVPCIRNCVTMFASTSGKSAYRSERQGSYLPVCFLKAVQNLREGQTVNIVHLLHTVSRLMASENMELKREDESGDKNRTTKYMVANLGSIVYSLTRPFLCKRKGN